MAQFLCHNFFFQFNNIPISLSDFYLLKSPIINFDKEIGKYF